MRRKTTKDYLAESFLELAEKIPVNKITITDITDNCDYSQPTFYNHFKDKYDLICWIARNNASNIMMGKKGDDFIEDTIDGFIKMSAEHKKVVTNILNYTFTNRAFISQIARTYTDVFCDKLKENSGTKKLPKNADMLIEAYFFGAGTLLVKWLVDDEPYSENELKKVMMESVPEKIKTYSM